MFSLMPPLSELEVVKVLTFGAGKYAPDNWKKIESRRYVDAAGRHINAHRRGETKDSESGLHHLAHAICCLMFQLEKELWQSKESAATNLQKFYAEQNKSAHTSPNTNEAKPADSTEAASSPTSSENSRPEKENGYYIHPPAIGQEYYYLSNMGVLDVRRWQSTPQEWKRLENKQVFYDGHACQKSLLMGGYIAHEEDPVAYPKLGKDFHYVYLSEKERRWVAWNQVIVSEVVLAKCEKIHKEGNAAANKEHAEAKAFWRNTSMQRHGTPYGPFHPDATMNLPIVQFNQSEGGF